MNIQQIAGVNKNVILVLNAGGAVDMSKWIDHVPAILHAWYPGQEGGTAVAQLLFGDFSPDTGSREGSEIAQVYVGDSHAPLPRPPKELKGFAKVSPRPGMSRQTTILLDRRAFSYYDVAKHDWAAAPAKFAILVRSSSVDIRLQGKYSLPLPQMSASQQEMH